MKKYVFPIMIAGAALFSAVGCDRTSDNSAVQTVDHDTYSQIKDITGSFNSGNNYVLSQGIAIPATDVVLVYRNVGSNASPVWQLLPRTYDLSGNRAVDYNFVFNTQQVQVQFSATFDATTMSATEKANYLDNQMFRIVLVPASTGKSAAVDYNDYNSVVKFYGLSK